MDWMNILERAGWTFLEAFLVALPATISAEMDGAAWKSVLLSAACAGLSAVKTLIIEIIHSVNAQPQHEESQTEELYTVPNYDPDDYSETEFFKKG